MLPLRLTKHKRARDTTQRHLHVGMQWEIDRKIILEFKKTVAW